MWLSILQNKKKDETRWKNNRLFEYDTAGLCPPWERLLVCVRHGRDCRSVSAMGETAGGSAVVYIHRILYRLQMGGLRSSRKIHNKGWGRRSRPGPRSVGDPKCFPPRPVDAIHNISLSYPRRHTRTSALAHTWRSEEHTSELQSR